MAVPGRSDGAIESIAVRAALACAKALNVPSPCTSVCRMNPVNGYCEGCLRTIDEILQWSRADDSAKRAIWTLLAQRADTVIL